MTHKDIYTKFMIEYDKAGASTSYPSLTEYEVATVLDKAYNALIAQKVTGNNYRRVAVEGDLKSIADLGPLTKSEWVGLEYEGKIAPNVTKCTMPEDLLYILSGSMTYKSNNTKWPTEVSEQTTYNPADGQLTRGVSVKLMNHEIASKFFATSSNIPWVKEPVCFIEDRDIYVVYDPLNPPVIDDQGAVAKTVTNFDTPYQGSDVNYEVDLNDVYGAIEVGSIVNLATLAHDLETGVSTLKQQITSSPNGISVGVVTDDGIVKIFTLVLQSPSFRITYIRRPNTFVKSLPKVDDLQGVSTTGTYITYFDHKLVSSSNSNTILDGSTIPFGDGSGETFAERYTFECNSTVAEELISLAVAFALENVESQRLNSKLNMRGLEA